MNVKSIQETLPVLGFDGDVMLSQNLDMTIGLKLQLPELLSCSDEHLQNLHAAFRRLIAMLPAGTLLHRQDLFLQEPFNAKDAAANSSYLSNAYLNHFEGRKQLKHEAYLFISLLNKGLLKSYLNGSLLHPHTQKKKANHQKEQLEEVRDNVRAQLKQVGIESELLSKEAHINLLQNYLSMNFQKNTSLLGSLDFRDHLKVMNHFVECYSLSDYNHLPTEVSCSVEHPSTKLPVSMVYPLTFNLPFSHITNCFIYVGNQNSIKAQLENAQKKIYSLSKFSTENKLNAELISCFLETVQQGGDPIVQMHFNLMLFDESLQGLKHRRSAAATAFSQMNCLPYRHSFDLPLMYWASMPGSTQLPETELMLMQAPEASCFINYEGGIQSSESPFYIHFSDRLNGCPVKVDISDEPMEKHHIHNRNKIIIGGSGSGKSFLTNHLLRHYAESDNCHVVLLDVGRSYELLVRYLKDYLKDKGGAMLVEFTDEQPISFNPFVLTDGLCTERKQTILSVLYTIYKPNLSEVDKDVIAQSLTAYYKKHNGNHSFNNYYEFSQEWIPLLVKDKGLMFNVGEYFFILSKYYEGGEYDYLLNKQMQTDEFFRCPFIVFELDNIKDHPVIFPVATLIIIDIFMQKMRLLKGTRKVICIEEAWKAIATPQMADYIKYFFKTIRKFFGEAMVVTQEIEDVLSSPIIKDAIINNADTKILLDMRKFTNKFERISQVLGLTDFQKEQILSVNRHLPTNRKLKECFVGLGSYSRVLALEVSRQEYHCYTSEEKEKEAIKQQLACYDNFIELLKNV
ncbi:TraG family conjugative transposon ATPase [Carboxylicivirga marina]|uniref:TraG family conjugative transposon ATPase n=1 Tax=Carboxylicivirga marina TaxID=2800988 RepID=A0ABS1HKX5_9BACT|nr:TraG family conjugative transposon ATPase [Carboxylicivirga marina]MBK3518255.1 TraG family conjugative transposon ATPase [Carboxylicivirga marina]